MKKFLAIAVIAASFVACNEGEKKTEETKTGDTSVVTVPTPAGTDTTVKVTNDTTVKVTTTTDTSKMK